MEDWLYIAIDLGAGSGRVFLAGVAPGELLLEEIARFHYPAHDAGGRLCWDLPQIFEQIKAGVREAGARARRMGRRIRSLGIDSWGVDYGLVDDEGTLLELPVCYRDERTRGVMEGVFARVPRDEIFARTGIQFLVFNTLFQLCAHVRTGLPPRAAHLLLIPDLINSLLTGQFVTEYTNGTTTQMINAQTRTWDRELLERLDLPVRLLTKIVAAGTDLGPLRPAIAAELGLDGVRVIAPATHDTASAVAGAPLEADWAYISSGTWSLVGVERGEVLASAGAAYHNFTNEGGAFGTVRFLKNVMGLWILEACRREWQQRGLDVNYDSLVGRAAALATAPGLIFPDDARFFNPPSMLAAIAAQMNETYQNFPGDDDPPAVTRIVLDSLALRYASVLATIEALTGRVIRGVEIVGGGSLNEYLNQATADAARRPVLAGPVEATVIGNALVQAVAAGRFRHLSEARQHVAANLRPKEFFPIGAFQWAERRRLYAALERRARAAAGDLL